MEEKILTNEVMDVAEKAENLMNAAADMDKAVALQKTAETAASAAASNGIGGKTILVGGSCLVAGGIIGYSLDHWGIPAVKKGWAKHKAKKAQKKAEKAAKKAAKDKPAAPEKAKEAPKPAPAEPAEINPMDIDTTID